MSEQNWATQEAYNWLANDEAAYNEIMSVPQEERQSIILSILARWYAGNGPDGFKARKEFMAIDSVSLAADFPDEPRYAHDCAQCTFLGHYEEYDLYYHEDPIDRFISALSKEHSYLWRDDEIKILMAGIKLASKIRGVS